MLQQSLIKSPINWQTRKKEKLHHFLRKSQSSWEDRMQRHKQSKGHNLEERPVCDCDKTDMFVCYKNGWSVQGELK